MQSYQNLIGGEWTNAASGKTFSTTNPADTRETVATYPHSAQADAQQAIAAAKAAFAGWAAQTAPARGRILSKASQIIESRKPELAGHGRRAAVCDLVRRLPPRWLQPRLGLRFA